ncbi:MAG: hypothetical protein AMXMBFR64_35300 [Myxococcales bacterium]
MYRLSGWHEHTIDDKGRTSIPSAFREKLRSHDDKTVYVTRAITGSCLDVYPASVWERILDEVGKRQQSDPAVITFRRGFISAAVEAEPDKAGRIMLPQRLRERVGLTKDIVISGNIDKMEIWDRALFERTQEETDDETLLAAAREFGF